MLEFFPILQRLSLFSGKLFQIIFNANLLEYHRRCWLEKEFAIGQKLGDLWSGGRGQFTFFVHVKIFSNTSAAITFFRKIVSNYFQRQSTGISSTLLAGKGIRNWSKIGGSMERRPRSVHIF